MEIELLTSKKINCILVIIRKGCLSFLYSYSLKSKGYKVVIFIRFTNYEQVINEIIS